MSYKGTDKPLPEVSRELAVDGIVEGSVFRAGERVRITAQLIDATTGNHVWSERYDRRLEDIFAIQDDIRLEIMNAVHIKLLDGEQVRHWHTHGTTNLQATEKIWQARGISAEGKEGLTRARRLYEESIVLDPNFAYAYALYGNFSI